MAKPKKFLKILSRIFLIFLIILCCALGFAIGKAYSWISEVKDKIPDNNVTDLQVKSLTTYIYDKNGKKIDELKGAEDRDWVSIDQIPAKVKNSFIAIEDERFYQHKGIDLYRILGALWIDLKTNSRNQGASTITQQYIKMFVLDNTSKAFKRKVQEQYLAVQFEKRFSKEQILQAYLNNNYLGHGAYGVGSAAKIYFGKTVGNLTVAESAVIAATLQSPTEYDPYLHFESSKKRQRLVLRKMLELNFITPSEYYEALNENIKGHLVYSKTNTTKTRIHSYFVETVIQQVRNTLKSRGENPNLVYTGGLRIYTTLDPAIQKQAEESFNTPGLFPTLAHSKDGTVQPQAAMTIIDYHTGEVKAIVGGRGEKTANLVFNRAYDSLRQPGSSIKPLSVYGPAIDQYGYNEYSTVVDSPFSIGNWTPRNDSGTFSGSMTFKQALTWSTNIPAVKILHQIVGYRTSYNYLTQKFGIKTLDPNLDKFSAPSLALGGLTHGVRVYDMAAAYGVIANKGIYVTPHTYTLVKDSMGNIVIDNKPTASRSISEDTAVQLTDMLQNVIQEGTAKLGKFKEITMPEAGKTGTTSSTKDKWFVGFTPYYSAAVWMGYDNPTPMNITTNYSVVAWRQVMEDLHKNLPTISFFQIPDGITPIKPTIKKVITANNYVKVDICSESGLIAGPWCPPEDIKTKTFELGKEPTEYCNIHKPSDDSSSNYDDSEADYTNSTNSSGTQNYTNTTTTQPSTTAQPSATQQSSSSSNNNTNKTNTSTINQPASTSRNTNTSTNTSSNTSNGTTGTTTSNNQTTNQTSNNKQPSTNNNKTNSTKPSTTNSSETPSTQEGNSETSNTQ